MLFLSIWTAKKQDRLVSAVFERVAQDGLIDVRNQQWIRESMVRYGSMVPRCIGESKGTEVESGQY